MLNTPQPKKKKPEPQEEYEAEYVRTVYDPTRNTIALVDAAVRRLDDLRDMRNNHTEAIAVIRADYENRLRMAEAARIDAIRAVDVAATAASAAIAESRASTLAMQVTAQADTLRSQVATVAAAAAQTLSTSLAPISKAIEELRANQFLQQGEKSAKVETREQSQWGIGTLVSIVFGSVGLLGFIISFFSGTKH